MLAIFEKELEQDLEAWMINFEEKLPNYSKILGINDEMVELAQAYSHEIRRALHNSRQAKANAAAALAAIPASEAKYLPPLRGIIQKLKTSFAYTDVIGSDLRINGADVLMEMSYYKPLLAGETTGGNVVLKFNKRGVDGVNIYTRLVGESKWKRLCYDTNSPYIDNRKKQGLGNYESREYMCHGVINDDEIGQQSNIIILMLGE